MSGFGRGPEEDESFLDWILNAGFNALVVGGVIVAVVAWVASWFGQGDVFLDWVKNLFDSPAQG